jgi:hypothetical protein
MQDDELIARYAFDAKRLAAEELSRPPLYS